MAIPRESTPAKTRYWGRFAALVAAVWLTAGLMEFVLAGFLTPKKPGTFSWHELFCGIAGFWGLAALLSPAVVWATCRARRARGRPWGPAAIYIVTLVLLIFFQSQLRWWWMNLTVWQYQLTVKDVLQSTLSIASKFMGGGMLVYVGVVGATLAWDYYQRYRIKERAAAALELEQARLRASLSEARLGALQMQLQPHFLFNALHAISTLILKGDNRGANEMLSHLSRFLRMTLDRADSPTVPLAVELESLDAYLRIQRERFRDRLHIVMAIDERTLSAPVPNLIFQPLVENSILHGIASETGSGTITVRASIETDSLILEVEDDGLGLPEGEAPAAGVGLCNIRERLAQLYPGAYEFTLRRGAPGGTLARIRIPFGAAAPGTEPPTG
jgi:two-component system LytT family sensor kinase